MNPTKTFLWLFFLLMAGSIIMPKLLACNITVETMLKNQKIVYTGDTVIIIVKVALIHSGCPHAIEETKTDIEGMEIISITKWKSDNDNWYQKKYKVRISGKNKEKAKFTAYRTCDAGGGSAVLTMDIQLKEHLQNEKK